MSWHFFVNDVMAPHHYTGHGHGHDHGHDHDHDDDDDDDDDDRHPTAR
jgi:hypothetical protein